MVKDDHQTGDSSPVVERKVAFRVQPRFVDFRFQSLCRKWARTFLTTFLMIEVLAKFFMIDSTPMHLVSWTSVKRETSQQRTKRC